MARKDNPITLNWAENGVKEEINDTLQDAGWNPETAATYLAYQMNFFLNSLTNNIKEMRQSTYLLWRSDITYNQFAFVVGSNNSIYYSKVNDNINNDPTLDVTNTNWATFNLEDNNFRPVIEINTEIYTITTEDFNANSIFIIDTSDINIIITLPLESEISAGRRINIIPKSDETNITITKNDGSAFIQSASRSFYIERNNTVFVSNILEARNNNDLVNKGLLDSSLDNKANIRPIVAITSDITLTADAVNENSIFYIGNDTGSYTITLATTGIEIGSRIALIGNGLEQTIIQEGQTEGLKTTNIIYLEYGYIGWITQNIPAISDNDLVIKSLLDSRLASKADVNGDADETFNAANPTEDKNVVNLDYFRANVRTSTTLAFPYKQLVCSAEVGDIGTLDSEIQPPFYIVTGEEYYSRVEIDGGYYYNVNDNGSSIYRAITPTTAEDWNNLNNYGGVFQALGVQPLTSVSLTSIAIALGVTGANNPVADSDQRYIIFAGVEDLTNLIWVKLGSSGTSYSTGITNDNFIDMEVVIPPGLGNASVYINGVLQTETLPFEVNSNTPDQCSVTSLSSGETGRSFNYKSWGVVINQSSNTISPTASNLIANDVNIITRPTFESFTINTPAETTNPIIGNTYNLLALNKGDILIQPEDQTSIKSIFNNRNTYTRNFTKIENITGTVTTVRNGVAYINFPEE